MLTFSYLLMTLLMFSGIFLIGLILLQRGRGGGLAGAFGGMGGQSAFGTKAGDVFTRITIVVAAVWILLCAGGVVVLRQASTGLRTDDAMFKKDVGIDVKKAKPADEPGADEGQIPPAAGDTPGKKQDNPPADTPAKTETEEKDKKPDTKSEDKPAEPAPAAPGDKPEPDKDKPAEEKPAAEKPADEKPAEPPK